MQYLELFRVGMIATGHAHVAQQELRKEGQIETYEHDERREAPPSLRIHAAADLRPPVVQAAQVAHEGASDHDVVEVRNNEIGVCEVHVQAERCQVKAGHSSDREEADESECVQHRCVI